MPRNPSTAADYRAERALQLASAIDAILACRPMLPDTELVDRIGHAYRWYAAGRCAPTPRRPAHAPSHASAHAPGHAPGHAREHAPVDQTTPAGDHAYQRDEVHPQGTGRPWRGARYGEVTNTGPES